jgi:hypothetical protein
MTRCALAAATMLPVWMARLAPTDSATLQVGNRITLMVAGSAGSQL